MADAYRNLVFHSVSTSVRMLKDAVHAAMREAYLSYRFIWRDLSATVIPATIFTLAALKSRAHYTLAQFFAALSCTVIYVWLYVYAFCLANQLVGIEEDRTNKPDRPLVIGLVSIRGAQWRWRIVTLIFMISGWYLEVLRWSGLWILCIVLHNFHGWSKHWFRKNLIIMPIGTVALLASAWQFAAPLNPIIWRWIILLSVVIGITINLQDLRDLPGDRQIGRQTMPIAWGEARTRIMLCGLFILLALSVHFGLMMPAGRTCKIWFCSGCLAVINIWIAARIILYRTNAADHKTYMLYTYWFCCVMASAIVVL